MEKNDFEKRSRFFFSRNFDFSIEKIEIFFEIFFKMIFLHDEKIFFDGIFFKVYLLVKENRFEAVPG